MPVNFNSDTMERIQFIVGTADNILKYDELIPKIPFDEEVIHFIESVSRCLILDKNSRKYPDVVTFAYWIRKSSLEKLKARFDKNENGLRLGRGIAFHIAPSNVPVNFAYSLIAGLIFGNGNIVRVPSKNFPQIEIIANAFQSVLSNYPKIAPYVTLLRYERNESVNDLLSSLCNVRIVWGGDNTIAELRKSPLPPRSSEITFSDRYSLAIIDSESYLSVDNKERLAENFYNDTYLSDQNACTSPNVIVWMGEHVAEAKEIFWNTFHKLVLTRYELQPIKAIDKLTSSLIAAVNLPHSNIEPHGDNFIIRILVHEASPKLIDYRESCGFFFEYDCKDLSELKNLCNDNRCQTIGYIGKREAFLSLIISGIKGVDRIVPIGKTMDFDFIWDGYDLSSMLTRTVVL